MDITTTVDRKQIIRASVPVSFVRQRIYQAAQELNLAGELAARVELANEALCRLVELLYQPDSDGHPAHIDPATGRILVPLPWGSVGWKRWGLRHHEAVVLRMILLARQCGTTRPALFLYGTDTRCWYLNTNDYPTLPAAAHWLKRSAILLAEWRQYMRRHRDDVTTVRRRYVRRRNDGVTTVH